MLENGGGWWKGSFKSEWKPLKMGYPKKEKHVVFQDQPDFSWDFAVRFLREVCLCLSLCLFL